MADGVLAPARVWESKAKTTVSFLPNKSLMLPIKYLNLFGDWKGIFSSAFFFILLKCSFLCNRVTFRTKPKRNVCIMTTLSFSFPFRVFFCRRSFSLGNVCAREERTSSSHTDSPAGNSNFEQTNRFQLVNAAGCRRSSEQKKAGAWNETQKGAIEHFVL